MSETRVNVTGQQGTRRYLAARGVTFGSHNPTVAQVLAEIERLRGPHMRHRGHLGCRDAAGVLTAILVYNGIDVTRLEKPR